MDTINMDSLKTNLYWKSLRQFLSPVEHLLDDLAVSEIMINGGKVFFETKGQIHATDIVIQSSALMAAVRNLAQFVGKELHEDTRHMSARLPDGSRVQVVLPPCSRSGILISVRKFSKHLLTLANMIEKKALTAKAAKWLEHLVCAKKNIVVAGGTGSGKTTLLNILGVKIPQEERILALEETQELQIDHPHLVSMETVPATGVPPRGAVTMRDLVTISLRMRPDRIIIGEVRGGEALDLLQAMATGHSGSMCTLHSNDPAGALRRLETMATYGTAGDIPLSAIRSQVASSVEVVVQVNRFSDGTRKLTHISEVLPLDLNGDYNIRHIFAFKPCGKTDKGEILGKLEATGAPSVLLDSMRVQGFDISSGIFEND
jgi:pilus assembly protein CpaF